MSMRALRLVALLESLSFAVLLVGSVLKRTTGPDLVPVLGALHGGLFLALVVLVLASLEQLRWAWWFTLVMLTVGSPGAHFAVRATRTSSTGPESAPA
jgi:integral membrane protein